MTQRQPRQKSVTFSDLESMGTSIQPIDPTNCINISDRDEMSENRKNLYSETLSHEAGNAYNYSGTSNSDYKNGFKKFIESVKPFNNIDEENMYRKYKYSQIIALTKCLSFTGSLLCVTSLILTSVYMPSQWRLQLFLAISFGLHHIVSFSCLTFKFTNDKCRKVCVFISSSSICVQICGHMLIDYGTMSGVMSKFEWILVVVYLVYIVCPVSYHLCLVINISFFTLHSISYTITWILNGNDNHEMQKQIAANIMYFIVATTSGSVMYFMIDGMHRTSFVETRLSLATKRVIEEELQQQERLLTSVLPKHVAEEIVRDFGGEMVGPFRKMYMMRHENVSILFADIVGFTAISSKCSAADLVKLLNDLFANFDKLSQKYSQLRLKILGDCYYCICGVPTPRKDHAALSVYMGLAMVDAIGFVRKKMRTDVNMRVGIHTGAVLGGVLGQRQWQFDVLGKDVIIANKMESSGVPGRVHICHVTMQDLHGEFELEEAKVGPEHSFIKENGLQTYLVKSVLIPFKPSFKHISSLFVINSIKDSEIQDVAQTDNITQQLEYLNQLHALSHDSGYCLLTLRLHDKTQECQYQGREHICPELWCICFLILLVITFFGNAVVNSVQTAAIIVYATVCLVIVACLVLRQGRILFKERSDYPRKLFHIIRNSMVFRFTLISIVVVMTVGANTSTLISWEDKFDPNVEVNKSIGNISSEISYDYPYYYTNTAVLVIITLSTVTVVDHITKSAFSLLMLGFHIVSLLVIFRHIFDNYDQRSMQTAPSVIIQLCSFTGITFAVAFLDRQLEHMSRKQFVTRVEINEQKQKVIHLKRKNEALVYNILPRHVAKEFLGRNKQDNELYSHAYDDVGVMFAACPNFDEFYNETSINKDGLECLRFLNEIISDYDELLKESRFKTICKIKTIASTYMVASGLMYDDPITKKMPQTQEDLNHLDDLVQYAFAMKETLNRINSQSFNDFQLRIGINCGPVIAGVIGAKKPHYDIWGNTVNVASRMETTCQLGKIQVVQETKDILCGFGYHFQSRGVIKVKGKGDLMTFYLSGNRESSFYNGKEYSTNNCQPDEYTGQERRQLINSSTEQERQTNNDQDINFTLPNQVFR